MRKRLLSATAKAATLQDIPLVTLKIRIIRSSPSQECVAVRLLTFDQNILCFMAKLLVRRSRNQIDSDQPTINEQVEMSESIGAPREARRLLRSLTVESSQNVPDASVNVRSVYLNIRVSLAHLK